MKDLNFTEKFQALKALDNDAAIKMSIKGDWYVEGNWSIKDGSFLVGGTYYDQDIVGTINGTFDLLSKKDTIVVLSKNGKRREVTWAGFMWRDV